MIVRESRAAVDQIGWPHSAIPSLDDMLESLRTGKTMTDPKRNFMESPGTCFGALKSCNQFQREVSGL